MIIVATIMIRILAKGGLPMMTKVTHPYCLAQTIVLIQTSFTHIVITLIPSNPIHHISKL